MGQACGLSLHPRPGHRARPRRQPTSQEDMQVLLAALGGLPGRWAGVGGLAMPTKVLDCSQEATGDIWGGRHLHGGGGPGSASWWVRWDLSSPSMLRTRPEAAPRLGKRCPPGRPQAFLDPTRRLGCPPGPVDGKTPMGVPRTRSHCRSHIPGGGGMWQGHRWSLGGIPGLRATRRGAHEGQVPQTCSSSRQIPQLPAGVTCW